MKRAAEDLAALPWARARRRGADAWTGPFALAGPLLGIAFVLLIYFSSRPELFQAAALAIGPPAASLATGLDELAIRVSNAGTLHFDGRHLDLVGLKSALADRRFAAPQAGVVVLVEDEAKASLIFRVIEQCRLAGARSIRLEMAGRPFGDGV